MPLLLNNLCLQLQPPNQAVQLTAIITGSQLYETKAYFEAYPEVDFSRNFTRVIRGNIRAVYRLLEIDQRLWSHRCAQESYESYHLLRLWFSQS